MAVNGSAGMQEAGLLRHVLSRAASVVQGQPCPSSNRHR